MSKAANWVKEHLAVFLLTVVFAGGLYYSATTSWQNSRILADQSQQMAELRSGQADIKRSLISVLLDKNPNKSQIIRGLVNDSRTQQGIDRFRAGNFDGAYAVWSNSAHQGSTEAIFAISAANAELKARAGDSSLPPDQRAAAAAALIRAPSVEPQTVRPHVSKHRSGG